ncbi:conserved hypothetical protein [Streptomyces misionensis JCM 4497]
MCRRFSDASFYHPVRTAERAGTLPVPKGEPARDAAVMRFHAPFTGRTRHPPHAVRGAG